MKTKTKDMVIKFMTDRDTSNLNSNEFIFEYYKILTWDSIINETQFRYWPSTESITRLRRYIIQNYWIGKRTKADTESEYIEAYWLKNKIHTWLKT
jgi:hypothetical protein